MNDRCRGLLALVGARAQALGTEAWFVGGGVRDWLLGRALQDLDFALPDKVRAVAEAAGKALDAPCFALEEERDIYRVVLKDVDPKGDGIRLDFARFKAPTIVEDLSLRDFSVNAMAARLPLASSDPSRAEVLDPHNGRKDLEGRLIRQVSPQIYQEDPLRLLRAFRIACQLQARIEPSTLESICAQAADIRKSAAERIREELMLLFEEPISHPFVIEMDRAGLMSALMPEIDPNRDCALDYYPGKGVWGHSTDGLDRLEWILGHLPQEFPEDHARIAETVFGRGEDTEGHTRSALMKLAILLHDVGKAPTAKRVEGRLRFFLHDEVGGRIAKDIAGRLRFSASAAQGLSSLVLHHMRPGGLAHIPDLTDRARYRFFRDLGGLAFPMLLVALADRYTYLTDEELGGGRDAHERSTKELIRWYYARELEQQARKPRLLNGHVLMEKLGLEPGKLVGELLAEVEEAAALGEIATEEAALELARRKLSERKSAPPA